MNSKHNSKSLFVYLLIGFAVTLPLGLKLNNYVLAGLLLVWLKENIAVSNRLRQFNSKEFWLAAGLFFIYAVSLLYSDNLKQGFRDIEHKLGLLIFPLILLTKNRISKKEVDKVIRYFSGTCLVLALFLPLAAVYRYSQSRDAAVFFYHQFADSLHMHAVYLSAYFAVSGLFFLKQARNCLYIKEKAVNGAAVLVLLLNLLLLSSKTILAVYTCIAIFYLLWHFYKSQKLFAGIFTTGIFAVVIVLAVLFIPKLKERATDVITSQFSVLNQDQFRYDTPFSGLTLRLLFWKYAAEIVHQEKAWLWGIGTGDSQDALNAKYKKHNLYLGNGAQDIGYFDYNTHNQFVETYLKTGLLGTFFLIFYFGRNVWLAQRRKNFLYLAFLTMFIAFSLTESTLQGNKGIVFFAFFNSLFLSYLSSKEHQEKFLVR